jgi:transcriptional/translational regulatory protein YebC/TACO1
VRCDVHAFDKVAQVIDRAGIKADASEIAYIPNNTVPVTDVRVAQTLAKLHEALDELDDVQAVFSNEEMDEAISAAAQS